MSSMPSLPSIGYAMYFREMAIDKLDVAIDNLGFSQGNLGIYLGKNLLNSAIRCTSYSIPYLSYLSWPYAIHASKYINLGLGLTEGVYAAYSYYQAHNEHNVAKKQKTIEKAKEAAQKALLYGACAAIDVGSTYLNAEVVVYLVSAYVGFGALSDLAGWSNKIHEFLFQTKAKEVPSRGEVSRRVSSLLRMPASRVRADVRAAAAEDSEEDFSPLHESYFPAGDYSEDEVSSADESEDDLSYEGSAGDSSDFSDEYEKIPRGELSFFGLFRRSKRRDEASPPGTAPNFYGQPDRPLQMGLRQSTLNDSLRSSNGSGNRTSSSSSNSCRARNRRRS